MKLNVHISITTVLESQFQLILTEPAKLSLKGVLAFNSVLLQRVSCMAVDSLSHFITMVLRVSTLMVSSTVNGEDLTLQLPLQRLSGLCSGL